MKGLRIALFVMVSFSLAFTLAFAAGDPEKGKALFSDPRSILLKEQVAL